MESIIRLATATALVTAAYSGPFAPAAGQPGSDAISASDIRFSTWASAVIIERGPTEIGFPESSLASYGIDDDALGPADATPESPYSVVSLGDGGTATLEFTQPFGDAPGPDFAVFENSFSDSFLELAHVEVSSDGVSFFRFPSTSLTASGTELGEGGAVDPSDVHNLAGKYLAGFGTPFDLAELRSASPLLDIQRITHVRLIDAVGSNDPAFASFDSLGNKVVDPYPTPYFSGGFDLDAVGAFHQTATTYGAWLLAQGISDPSPSLDSDQNSVPNLIEYLTENGKLILNPDSPEPNIQFKRLTYRTDGNLRLEGSTNLQLWTPLATSEAGATMVSAAQGVTVSESGTTSVLTTVTLPPGSTWKFFRLSAEP